MPGLIVSIRGDTARIIVPDTVVREAAFTVQVSTFGGSCISEVDRTDVSLVDASTVEIRPYDRLQARCGGDALRYLSHMSSIKFAQPGVAHIRIVGDRGGAVGGDPRAPMVVERSVVVR